METPGTAEQGGGADDLPDDALHGGGGPAVRPAGDHRSRPGPGPPAPLTTTAAMAAHFRETRYATRAASITFTMAPRIGGSSDQRLFPASSSCRFSSLISSRTAFRPATTPGLSAAPCFS